MNNFKNNYKIYFMRLCRHLENVIKYDDHISYLDLTHSFRCLIDVKSEIDTLMKECDYHLIFNKIVNIKEIRPNEYVFTSPIVYDCGDGSVISDITIVNRSLTDEEMDNIKKPKHVVKPKEYTFSEWLGIGLDSYVTSTKKYITIEDSIRRVANRYGASHPSETPDNERCKEIDQVINMKMNNRLGNKSISAPYLAIRVFALEFVKASLDFFTKYQDDENLLKAVDTYKRQFSSLGGDGAKNSN